MEEDAQVVELLTEIRNGQREHLAEYRRIAERSVALQEASVAKYEQLMRMYRFVLIAVVVVLVVLVAYVFSIIFL